jgi:hypothetical protein
LFLFDGKGGTAGMRTEIRKARTYNKIPARNRSVRLRKLPERRGKKRKDNKEWLFDDGEAEVGPQRADGEQERQDGHCEQEEGK